MLKPWNKEAFEQITEAFKISQRVCTVRATGTGKSYLTAALVSQYKKKSRVLVVTSNLYIQRQNSQVIGSKCKYTIYSSLHKYSAKKNAYDLICLDEYHRAGAPTWETSVHELLDNNPNAKVFGTTATNIRYLDDCRNMSDELFGGNIVAPLTLAQAWARGILQIPEYYVGLYSFDAMEEYAKRKLRIGRMDAEEQALAYDAIKDMHLQWENSFSTEVILEQHLKKSTKRIIVFCDRIERIEEARSSIVEWVTNAGFNVLGHYTVNSEDNKSLESIEEFETPFTNRGVKIMFAVNMLNEGIHISNVDAIIMLRTTTSKIIYLQQLGRCLSAGSNKIPVVFDFVANLENSEYLQELKAEVTKEGNTTPKLPSKGSSREFTIVDFRVEAMHLLEKVEELFKWRSRKEWAEEVSKFFDTNKDYPSSKGETVFEKRLAKWLATATVNKYEEILALRNKLNKILAKEILENIAKGVRLTSFHEKNSRIRKLAYLYYSAPNMEDLREEVTRLLDEIRNDMINKMWFEYRMPNSNSCDSNERIAAWLLNRELRKIDVQERPSAYTDRFTKLESPIIEETSYEEVPVFPDFWVYDEGKPFVYYSYPIDEDERYENVKATPKYKEFEEQPISIHKELDYYSIYTWDTVNNCWDLRNSGEPVQHFWFEGKKIGTMEFMEDFIKFTGCKDFLEIMEKAYRTGVNINGAVYVGYHDRKVKAHYKETKIYASSNY